MASFLCIEFWIQMIQQAKCLDAPKSAMAKSAMPIGWLMIGKLLGTGMENMVMMTHTSQTIYYSNGLQVRATIPDSVMERQAHVVQGQ